MLPEPTILNSVARIVADTLREFYGLDPERVFRGAGMDPASLDVPRGRYPFAQHQRLWQVAAEATGDSCLGLRVGERVRPASFGVLSVAWMASTTLRDALHRLARYSRVISTGPHHLRLDEETEPCRLSYEYPPGSLLAPAVSVSALFVSIVAMARMVTQPDLRPREVWLRHAGIGQAECMRQYFGCSVLFGAPADAIAFDAIQLDTRLVGHETEVARSGDVAAESYLRQIDGPQVAAEVGRALVALLPAGEFGLEHVAARLNRGLSTLQRHLRQERLSYRQVLDQTRRQLAEGYLADPRRSLSEIAYLLGFADQSSFSRSFRRWTGVSPRDARTQGAQLRSSSF